MPRLALLVTLRIGFMISLLGVIAILSVAWLFSADRKIFDLERSVWLLLQVGFALLVLYVPAGKDILNGVTGAVAHLIDYGQEGISFIFGGLASEKVGFVFAIHVLGIIIFFCVNFGVIPYWLDAESD